MGGDWFDPFGLREFGKNAFACLCCLLCTGPVLLIVGIALLVSSMHDYRADRVNAYNVAVENWNHGMSREYMKELEFDVWVTSPSADVDMVISKEADPIDDRYPEELLVPKPLKHQHMGPPPSQPLFCTYGDVFACRYDIGFEWKQPTGPSGQIEDDGIPIDFVKEHVSSCGGSDQDDYRSCKNSCKDDHGIFKTMGSNTYACHTFEIASEICVAVSPNNDLRYTLVRGCFHNKEMVVYKKPKTFIDEDDRVDFSKTIFRVRSVDDPFIVGADVTENTFDFGMTVAEKRAAGTVCLVIGILFSIAPCVAAAVLMLCFKNKGSPAQPGQPLIAGAVPAQGYMMQPIAPGMPVGAPQYAAGQPGYMQPVAPMAGQPYYPQALPAGQPVIMTQPQ